MPRIYKNFKPSANKAITPAKENKTPSKPAKDENPNKDKDSKTQTD